MKEKRLFCDCCNCKTEECNRRRSLSEECCRDSWTLRWRWREPQITVAQSIESLIYRYNKKHREAMNAVKTLENKLKKLPNNMGFRYDVPETVQSIGYKLLKKPIICFEPYSSLRESTIICVRYRYDSGDVSTSFRIEDQSTDIQAVVLKHLPSFEAHVKEKLKHDTELLETAFPTSPSRWWW